MSLTVVAVLLCLSAALQLCYYLFLFQPALRRSHRKYPKDIKQQPPVTVLICAFNEAQNLKQRLPSMLTQDYPAYEVMVVNDRSSDDTAFVLAELSAHFPHLRVVTITPEEPRLFPGKKFALSRGIAAASQELLLLTDADCQPAGKDWLSEMVQPLTNGKDIAAGFGDFEEEKGWLNAFVKGETLHTFLQLTAYHQAGLPYMAVGRNLAVRKSLLLKAQSHPLWQATPSGDDDMLIRLCATKHNMAVVISPGSATYSPAKKDFKSYIRQKQRHLSTGKLYRAGVRLLLGFYAFSHATFWLSALLLGVLLLTGSHEISNWVVGAFYLFLLRNVMFWNYLNAFQKKMRGKKKSLLFWPYFDLMWLGYNFAFSPYILWKTKQDWH